MIDLKSIRVFLAVAERASFSDAARDLQISAASVTRIVSALEEALGKQLLVRTTRQVALTSDGSLVVARYRPLLDQFDDATDELLRSGRPDAGKLRINAPLSYGTRKLPDVISGFKLAYPSIEIEVHLTDALLDVIEEDCDLAIRVSRPPKDKSTIWRKLAEVPRLAVASPQLFERTQRPVVPSDLDPKFLLSYSEAGTAEHWEFRKGTQSRSLRAGTDIVSNNGDFLLALAIAGEGICVLPDFIVADALHSGALETVLPEWSLPSLWLTLYYPPYEKLPPIVETFARYFEAWAE